ncbi:hypothetical protein COM90_25365 [Bacillus thuringiensis]|uniref:DUF3953 domain-containing protein n=1 Tax=Bacillus thuringiensis TaxID=1428 RepID=A0AB36TMY4_BACTU|nr:hypothetical protein COM74_11710 [Bacillus thuringiensis]PEE86044.1 hypothetical protein COM90_25365 [Bacillus thuringiensis]PFM84270.1 hypothetical protein COJ61_30220 [Bacillus thuringiensis]
MKKTPIYFSLLCLLITIISFIFLITRNVGINEFLLLGIIQLGVLGTVFGIIKSTKSTKSKLRKIIIWILPLFSLAFLCFLFTKII